MSILIKKQCAAGIFFLVLVLASAGMTLMPLVAYASENHKHKEQSGNDHDHEEHKKTVTLASETARNVGIRTAVAGAGIIERHLQVYGRLVTPSDQSVHVQGRFQGVIQSVKVNVGDRVNKGDLLAIIESNQSLKNYSLRAPISAVVQSRMANEGEFTGSDPLFTLINNDQLWAELKIFPSQRFEVKPGLDVHVVHLSSNNRHTHESRIVSVTPASGGEPFVIARTILDNPEGDMAPGDMIEADIDAEKISVPLRVDNRALQIINDETVVFVQADNEYEMRSLMTGRTDGRFTEVLSGLAVGEHYVVENSYLLKADLLKSGASHEH